MFYARLFAAAIRTTIMTWFIVALISTLLVTLVNYGDKFLVESQVPHPLALPVFLSIVNAFFALIFWLLSGFMLLPLQDALLIMFAGTAPAFAGYFYFQAVSRTEASRIVLLGQLGPVFILVLSMLFLGEHLSKWQLLGFALIIAAALAVSAKGKQKGSASSEPIWDVLGLMVMCNLIYAVSIIISDKIISELVMNGESVNWQALLGSSAYAAFGYFLGGMTLLLIVPTVRSAFISLVKQSSPKAFLTLSSVETIFVIRMFIFYLALSLGSASLVSVVGNLNIFFAIIFGWILTLWKPHVFKEDIRPRSLLQKAAWAAIAFTGVFCLLIEDLLKSRL
jgi:drug/metabolite transporter (DMT)-like permease